MPHSKHVVLSGTQLLEILAVTTGYVKILGTGGQLLGSIPVDRAVLAVRAGSYIGKCSQRRVHHLREVDNRKVPSHSLQYWSEFRNGDRNGCGMPVVQPHAPGVSMVTTRSRKVV